MYLNAAFDLPFCISNLNTQNTATLVVLAHPGVSSSKYGNMRKTGSSIVSCTRNFLFTGAMAGVSCESLLSVKYPSHLIFTDP